MSDRRPLGPILGSLLFFFVVPGTFAGWVPYRITGWRMQPPLLGLSVVRFAGAALLLAGIASLVESFARFALVGLGTPAPVAPPRRLVVSGQYRHVRNPMYLAVLASVVGQALVLGSTPLLLYAAAAWSVVALFVLFYEEPTLGAQFGADYEAYRRNVRRWWPRLRPWRGPGRRHPSESA